MYTVRLVPKNWEHPKGVNPSYLSDECGDFLSLWNCKGVPKPKEKEKAYYQMYKAQCGVPISPVMESPEELAHWLVDNEPPGIYEHWLRVCQDESGRSFTLARNGFMTGLEIEDATDIRVANFRRLHNI